MGRNVRISNRLLIALVSLGLSNQSIATSCDMVKIPSGVSKGHVVASTSGTPALYFRSNLDVNTDGTPRSYHPDDPLGKTIAFNNIANAMYSIHSADGKAIDCSPRKKDCFMRYISVFKEARDADWKRSGNRYFTTKGIIPWKMDRTTGRQIPCTIETGPFQGYFISQTSKPIDNSKDVCDQARYIDSFSINAIVIPKPARWKSQNVVADEFDLVAVRNRSNDEIRFAIIGDRGPSKKLGEGSIALAASLQNKIPDNNATYQQIRNLALADVDYIIFPTYDAKKFTQGPITAEKIAELGARAFAEWGGVARMDSCSALPASTP